MTDKKSAEVRTEETVRAARRPWRRPDFVESSACAEIGAYSFQAK